MAKTVWCAPPARIHASEAVGRSVALSTAHSPPAVSAGSAVFHRVDTVNQQTVTIAEINQAGTIAGPVWVLKISRAGSSLPQYRDAERRGSVSLLRQSTGRFQHMGAEHQVITFLEVIGVVSIKEVPPCRPVDITFMMRSRRRFSSRLRPQSRNPAASDAYGQTWKLFQTVQIFKGGGERWKPPCSRKRFIPSSIRAASTRSVVFRRGFVLQASWCSSFVLIDQRVNIAVADGVHHLHQSPTAQVLTEKPNLICAATLYHR